MESWATWYAGLGSLSLLAKITDILLCRVGVRRITMFAGCFHLKWLLPSTGGIVEANDNFRVNRNAILHCEDAGDEGGLMKCMFHVEDRHTVCWTLAAADIEQFCDRLKMALKLDEITEADIEESDLQCVSHSHTDT